MDYKFEKANQFSDLFFLPMMVGIVSSTMIFKWILNDTGIVNTVLRFLEQKDLTGLEVQRQQ